MSELTDALRQGSYLGEAIAHREAIIAALERAEQWCHDAGVANARADYWKQRAELAEAAAGRLPRQPRRFATSVARMVLSPWRRGW